MINNVIKYSILIPVYNAERYLTKCIESVLNQTYENYEVILVDDGSNDSSGIMCDEFTKTDKRIKAFHQTNQGLIMARRNGIAKATGDFCLFLDSDDYWDIDLLETINQAILQYKCDLVIFKYRKVSETGNVLFEGSSIYQDRTIFEHNDKEIIFKHLIISSELNNLVCKVVKRLIIDDTDYSKYKNLRNGEDLLQSIPLIYNASRIIYIDKPLYNYRITPSSITQTFNKNLHKDITTVREVLLEYLNRLEIDNTNNLALFYQFYIAIIMNYVLSLMVSNVPKKEKLEILNWIYNNKLYCESLKYIDRNNFSKEKYFRFYLFNKKKHRILRIYANVLDIYRTIRAKISVLGRQKSCVAKT